MSRAGIAGTIGAIFVAILVAATTYTVQENERALVTRFGRIIEEIDKPGLHFKTPFVDDVKSFDKRWLEWDGAPKQMPTGDKKYIYIDTFARWRIVDAKKFYKKLTNLDKAQSRLDDIIDGAIRNEIANRELLQIVRSSARDFERSEEERELAVGEFKVTIGRADIEANVLARASKETIKLGIELADVRIKRINYERTVQAKVFDRMISERTRIAERYRSEGQGKAAETMGKIERELKTIQSGAYREAEELRGKADAQAAGIYATAYNRDPELYKFLKTMETYHKTIDSDTILVLSTDADVLKYLKSEK